MSDSKQSPFLPTLPAYPVWHSQPQMQMMDKEDDPKPKEDPKDPPAKDETLGEGGKAALAAERKRADDAEKREKALLKEKEDREKAEMTEVDRLKSDLADRDKTIATLTTENLRYKVGIDAKLDPALINRLQGTDEASMKADAAELAKLSPTPKGPKADPSQGRKGGQGGDSTPKDDFIETMDDLFDNNKGD